MPCQIPPPTAPMAKAPPKSLRITHGLCTISIYGGIQNIKGRTRDPGYDLRVPWEKERRVCISIKRMVTGGESGSEKRNLLV